MVKSFRKFSFGDALFTIANTFLLILFGFATLYPMLYVLVKSLTGYQTDMMTGLAFKTLSFSAYKQVFEDGQIYNPFLLTVFVVIVSTCLHVIITMLAAFPLSKKNLPGRTGMLIFVLITMLFGGGLIPFYILIRELGLRNNVLVYIIPSLVSGFNIMITKNFLISIPQSLEESAKIDGATDWRVLWSIVVPMSKPIISTIALWYAVGKWNDWMTGTLYITRKALLLLQNVLREMLVLNTLTPDLLGIGQSKNYQLIENVKMAVVIIATLPVLIVYPFVQKYFIKGVMLGSIKE